VPGFGATTNIINGVLECGTPTDGRVADRIGYFQRYAGLMGVTTGSNLECSTQRPFGAYSPVPSPSPPPPARVCIYSIKTGDTFYSLAPNYGVTFTYLQSLNPGIEPTSLQFGQVRLAGHVDYFWLAGHCPGYPSDAPAPPPLSSAFI
jgi:hypothetical protein